MNALFSMAWRAGLMAVLALISLSFRPASADFQEMAHFSKQFLELVMRSASPETLGATLFIMFAASMAQFIPVFLIAAAARRFINSPGRRDMEMDASDRAKGNAFHDSCRLFGEMYFPYLIMSFVFVQLICGMANVLMDGG